MGQTRTRRRRITYAVLVVLLIVAIFTSAALGQYNVSFSDVARAIGAKLSLSASPSDAVVMSTLWSIRFPRIALGLLVGAALAVAGAVMQAVFSNPLAEPGIVGVSSGASVGASLAMVYAPAALGGYSVPLAAFASGLAAAATVYMLSRSGGKAEVLTLVLTGIAVTAVCSALTSIATYVAPTTARDQIVFWQMGSLNGAMWSHVGNVAVVVVVSLLRIVWLAPRLDMLALGEQAAGHVGVNVQAVRLWAIALAALLTAAAVSYAGVIAFVGLIVPHILRLIMGPLNRYLIPAAMLGGALLLTVADIAARNLIPYADLPIGIFTALVGGPTFFILLRSNLRGVK
ncbi:MAG: iron ABC transporter permease [Ancrocorticia sp.]|jgi:iron complex transport system permease protein|nr:iron ABC transporter permease [Ancrocorticia sp.]MCI1964419.1 iron ABC transporter permease [Ancrocorticia sp.]MCI2003178.1 iron ABC transporter permease [Ancrocorticia sp.]MCI2012927.1 iron ABC transporter permease [Ancrocorticia sp.]MCI2029979.1 iron ABC transporter permease [Ancrocorticia sp.]